MKHNLPKPNEQLVLLPDAMSTSPCIGWVLYVKRNNKLLPVTYCTAKLKDYMVKWYPCEKEAMGVVLSLNQCAHWIREATLPTLVGPDSLAVVKAIDLIRKGKHSSNPRLQSLLSSINRLNVSFFHNSAKAGQHIIPDHLSRLKDSTCTSKDCAIERFLDDIPLKVESMSCNLINSSTTLLGLSLEEKIPSAEIISATSVELSDQLLKSGPIPLGSRQTWIHMQKCDPDCQTVYKLKTLGEGPRKKTSNPFINKIYKESSVHRGLLIVRSFDNRKMREIDKVVVPPSYLDSILTVLHMRLNHPKQSQLRSVFERYFFSPKTEAALQELYKSCHLCLSVAKLPKELESYSPAFFPDHPGCAMNIDILKRAGQLILVNVDMFSSYVTGCFSSSEKAEDLADAIIQAVTPLRRANSVIVRVDKAPGLLKLANTSRSLLSELGIFLEPANDGNKNSNCVVDNAIKELESELRKISPSGGKLTSAQFAQALLLLNNKIRNRGFSAAEIHFARDSHDNQNLNLDDKQLKSQQENIRIKNHPYLAKSRAPRGKPQISPSLNPGDIVFKKDGLTKHTARDPFIVIDSNSQRTVLRKALHSSPFSDGSPILSPHTQTVDRKFLIKPLSTSRTYIQPFPSTTMESDQHV